MTGFDAIDALLAGARQETPLPPAAERRTLREGLNLSRAQLARTLSVSTSTVGGWESGRDPSGEVRDKYAYFLEGARTRLAEMSAEAPLRETPAEEPEPEEPAVGTAGGSPQLAEPADTRDDVEVLPSPRPCVLCGRPARHEVAGFAQHLDPAECGTGSTGPDGPVGSGTPAAHQESGRPAGTGRSGAARLGVGIVAVGRRVRTADTPDRIAAAVEAVSAAHAGHVEAATAALVKRAIPDAMALLDETRRGGRYDVVAHPWLPDILRRQSARGSDQVWEARPKWTRAELPSGRHEVTALDINGAYLSALKTHLPIGQLEHSTGNAHDRRRAGLHLITPAAWGHDPYLPNPLGSRDEPGPLWVTEPTLRLLLRLAGPKYQLCEAPEIHESWTSGATESLLEKFRVALREARDRAVAEDDEVTLEYVKAMYSKFVSTLGESNFNRELYRTDWMHLIRSQAFVNLWWKAHRAYDEGLTVVRVMGTDELHVIGDWRAVFPEGRGVTEVKVKDTYTVGASASELPGHEGPVT
ncbi:helix-turn-helix domain-containing protein [Streptomyces fructofermentans]|uniref:helix-turn-helix domain-containing protein n=1 Tax=Streptomyces fructofermentans TaxID=152141 RepID=UPI0037A0740A